MSANRRADQFGFRNSFNKDVVRRILAIHYRLTSTEGGPSWPTFIGHMKDSLWSLDLFRCESIGLQTYWVLVVMDQYTRRIIGFGIQRGVVDGLALCRMFKQAIRTACLPKYLSRSRSAVPVSSVGGNLRILGVTEIKTVLYTPWSHPFAERLTGTIRKERLDRLLFWTATDLEMKLIAFRDYYNGYRSHAGLKGETPIITSDTRGASLKSYLWSHIVVGCIKHQWRHEHEFAMNTLVRQPGEAISGSVEKQLGLKLERRKIAVNLSIVDSAEKPAAN